MTSKLLAALYTGSAIVMMAAPAHAQAQEREYNIPAGDLKKALDAFGRQAGAQVIYRSDDIRGIKSKGIKGKASADQALDAILAGTGFSARKDVSGAFAITGLQSRTERADQARSPDASEGEDAQEIVVTGTNIQGVYPTASPVQVYTSKDIARTGATTTEQFVAKLPQNLGTVSPFGSGTAARESVSGVDLRGLGVGTTLVLMNGRRVSLTNRGQTADLSLIPVSAIKKVEVLTDGASAIYGSDAIGGVVNFVLRDDFDGAETRLSYGGVTSGGLEQGNFTQTFGKQWGSGRALISFDAFKATPLDRDDRDYAAATRPGTLTPNDKRFSFLATGSQDIGDNLVVEADLLFAKRDVKSAFSNKISANPLNHTLTNDVTDSKQWQVNLGLNYKISPTLSARLLASYSQNESDRASQQTFINNPTAAPRLTSALADHSALEFTGILNGDLFELPGGALKFSVGAGLLDEKYTGQNINFRSTGADIGRRTTYAFAEVFAPLIAPEQNLPFAHRLELSIAARYTATDDRSRPVIGRDFGNATDPKIGALWAPFSGLNVRATYGTSFRAPSLMQIDPVGASNAQLFTGIPIPLPTGPASTVFILSGVSPDVQSETARTWTAGFDIRPDVWPGFSFSAAYYNIRYKDRIAFPNFGLTPLSSPTDFPEILARQPGAATIESILRRSTVTDNFTGVNVSDPAAAAAIFAANPNLWILDTRFRNLALSTQDGFDFAVNNVIKTNWGDLRLGANMTLIVDYKQQLLAGQTPFEVVDRVGFPVNLRGRVHAGYSHKGFDATLSLNYVDDYINPQTPTNPRALVDSWETVDLGLSYAFDDTTAPSWLRGVSISLSAQNLFDKDPPFVVREAASERFGFDPQNANPLGRIVVVGFSKKW